MESLVNMTMCSAGRMQVPEERTEGGWRLKLVEALRQAVLQGHTIKVHQLLKDGAPLVTDAVSDLSF